MVERNTQIDIVLPFYNDSDKYWHSVLYNYMRLENSNDRQVVGEERYRDWENLKYWFRAIEENCKWVNKVYLVVANESQIPSWLDTSYKKLKVVLHRNYIPSELLPTFNIMTIEDFFCKIPGLSNNYIYCNDDYFFLNKTTQDMFFKNDLPVYNDTETQLKKLDTSGVDGTFYQCLNNGMDLQQKILGDKAHWYALNHLPVSHKKDFEVEILNKYYNDFINANNKSKFRYKNNLSMHVFLCLYKDMKPYIKSNNYANSCYVTITKDTNFNDYKDKQMVCFNDTQRLEQKDFYEVKKRMLDFMESKFPNKSKFEKEENMYKCEALEDFSLSRFKEIINLERANAEKNKDGWIYKGDKFECEKELAHYLDGENAYKKSFVNVEELKPKISIVSQSPVEELQKETKVETAEFKTTKKKRKKTKYDF